MLRNLQIHVYSFNSLLMESQRLSHHIRTPSSQLRVMIVLESTTDHTITGEDVDEVIYFAVIDNFIVELKAKFNEHYSVKPSAL